MSKRRNPTFVRALMHHIRNESGTILVAAVKGGAQSVGRQLLEASRDVNQSSDALLGKLLAALKNGALVAGHEIITSGVNLAHGAKAPDSAPNNKSEK